MSDRKEYIVGLAKGVDFENFNNEMIATTGQGVVPNRIVDVANQRPLSKRLTHYYLTDEEANDLINDPRVVCVEIPPEKRKDIFPIRDASQTSNFSKTTSDSGPYVNWGLRRSNEETNVYGNATIVSGDYNYTLNGSGVDVVIQDSGIEPNHPEWQDENGVSRLKQIDWFTASGITGTQSSNHYRDFDGHGTHCAGIAAGKTYGWAKGADIYAQKLAGLEGTGDTGTGISISLAFDTIKEWHRRKFNNSYTPTNVDYTPSTGVMIITLGNHNIESGDKIRFVPGSLTFTSGKDNFTSRQSYPRSSGAPNTAGTDPFYNKDVLVGTVTTTTIEVNVGIISNTSEHRFVSALTGAIEMTGAKRLIKKRPTVVNMSWGYGTYFSGINGGNYRGTPWSGTTIRTDYGMIGGFDGAGYKHGIRVSSVDIDVEELLDEGVHVCIAAGNTKQKIDETTGLDYENYYINSFGQRKYHQGASPFGDDANIVGNIDSAVYNDGSSVLEQKATSSETGPGVTIFAPGTDIMSATSNTNDKSGEAYYLDGDYRQCNISGTSMASPQVAGILALYLQINPDTTPKQGKEWIQSQAKTTALYSPGSETTYTDDRSLLGGTSRFLFNPFNSKFGLSMFNSTAEESTSGAGAPSYSLTSDRTNVNEGGAVTFTLNTTNVTAGTSVPYTITGISVSDISGNTLTGNFVVGTTDSVTVTLLEDATTEGNENIILTLDNNLATISVLVNDTSSAVASYTLTASDTSVNEGDTFTITLGSTNVANGTNVPYTITGVSSADIGGASLTGLFVVGTSEILTLTATADQTTEGTETLSIVLDGQAVSANVDIGDTSQTPATPTYALTPSATSVNEGQSVTVTLTTSNVAAGTTLPYTITGVTSPDINNASLTGNFVTGTTDVVTINITADQQTEGTETLQFALNNGQANTSISINDTSTTPAGPTYTLTPSANNVDEGDTFTITLATTNVDQGTTLPYTISGVTSADIGGQSLTGNFVVGTSDQVTITVTEDSLTEGTETLTLALDNAGATTGVTIADTSVDTTPTYSLSTSANSVNEGGTFTITLTTTYVSPGTNVAYTITGVNGSDINNAPLTGNFTVNNNTATLVITASEDQTTEGAETLQLALNNGADSISIVINDTSQTPFNADYVISVTNVGNNYTLSGTDRNGSVSGSQPTLAYNNGDRVQFNVNSGTSSGHPFYIKTQAGSGTGNQASGVVGNGTQTVQWTIGSTGTYYYQCSIHGNMNNSITVS